MNQKSYNKITSTYEVLGITDFKLRNLKDLKEIYNIDLTKIKGYENLVANKSMFESFIIHFYNSMGLKSRSSVKPISVKFVKDHVSYLRFDYKEGENKTWLHVRGTSEYY